jgi:hypothetical protein
VARRNLGSGLVLQELWNYCNVLRDDGMSYGDYPSAKLRAGFEQLTYLLFLKMADEGGSLVRLVPVLSVFFCAQVRYHALM